MMELTPATHPITVVVPIYGDLPSLLACIESLQHNVDQSIHRVLLMNDNGPQADEIESALLEMIADDTAFHYERNPKNLGFVGNCNRAALELDRTDNDILLLNSDTVTTPGFIEELSAVLHASPENGAVCPRSNNATIASLPYKVRDPSVGRGWERTGQVHAALADLLPRSSVSPVAMGFCILIRRNLIERFGLFDEAFAPGYGEENDFCLRVGQQGFVSRIAHRALVYHVGGQSFVGARRSALRAAHEKLLVARYPYYPDAVQAYIHRDRDPIDVFADALVPGDDLARVLIDIDEAPDRRLRREDLDLLAAASAATDPTVEFTVSVPDKAFASATRRFPRLRMVRQTRLDGLWDLAIVRTPASPIQLARLNRTSLRWMRVDADSPASLGGFDDALATIEWTTEHLLALVFRYGRSVVDLQQLRARWRGIVLAPDFLDTLQLPRESPVTRLIRRAMVISPRLAGWGKAFIGR